MIEAICQVLPTLNKEELMAGSDQPPIMEDSGAHGTFGATPNIDMPGRKLRYVPLLSWAQAGTVTNGFLDAAYEHEGVISIDRDDRRAFGVKIRGDSMSPRIMEGDDAIVCPTWTLRPGDTVIARTVEGDVMCKVYTPRNGGRIALLSSFNPAYPPFELDMESVAWIYPVGQVVQNLRRS
jgi:SOS-response transcriptional repressor LexA